MKKLCAALLIFLGLASAALAPAYAENSVGPSNRIFCNKIATLTAGASSITQIAAAVAGQSISICGWSVTNTGATGTFSLSYGSGSNCATNTTVIIPPLNITSTAPATDHVSDAWYTIPTAAGPTAQALCITPSVATIAAVIYYTQF